MYAIRLAVCALLGVGALTLTGCAQPPQANRHSGAIWAIDEAALTGTTADSSANLAVRKKIALRVPELNIVGLKLKPVVQFLRDMGHVNIVVNWGALQAAGIDRDTVVDEIKLVNVTFEKALTTVLETVGGGQVDLQYVVDGGAITISTKEELAAKEEREMQGPTVTRAYEARDLIDEAGPAKWEKTLIRELIADALRRPVPKARAPVAVRGQHGTLAVVYRGRIAELAEAIAVELRRERVSGLLDLIRTMIDPNSSWEANGGTVGSVRYFNGRLIIKHTPEAHRRIARLLSVLRRQAAPIGAQRERDDEATGATTRPAK